MRVLTFLAYHKQKLVVVGLVGLSLVAQVQVIKDMQDLHPYEYMYFSPLIGGVAGANGKYEMDYWGICNKPAGEWLAQNYTKYTGKQSPLRRSTLHYPGDALSPRYISRECSRGETRFLCLNYALGAR